MCDANVDNFEMHSSFSYAWMRMLTCWFCRALAQQLSRTLVSDADLKIIERTNLTLLTHT